MNIEAKKEVITKRIAKEFSKIKDNINSLYCSKMQRAIETAEEIL